MTETQTINLTPEHQTIVAKLRYMARQYTNGSYARGGSPSGKHYLDEAADAIEELAQRAAVPVGEVKPAVEQQCWCTTCRPITMDDMRFVVCPECGNKRCPRAHNHTLTCTNSNAPGQPGSSWEHVKPATPPAPIEGWRPIETAPKDGTKLILACNGKSFIGFWFELPFKEFRDVDGFYVGQQDAEANWMRLDDGDECEPTHWMPLPAAPQPGDKA